MTGEVGGELEELGVGGSVQPDRLQVSWGQAEGEQLVCSGAGGS